MVEGSLRIRLTLDESLAVEGTTCPARQVMFAVRPGTRTVGQLLADIQRHFKAFWLDAALHLDGFWLLEDELLQFLVRDGDHLQLCSSSCSSSSRTPRKMQITDESNPEVPAKRQRLEEAGTLPPFPLADVEPTHQTGTSAKQDGAERQVGGKLEQVPSVASSAGKKSRKTKEPPMETLRTEIVRKADPTGVAAFLAALRSEPSQQRLQHEKQQASLADAGPSTFTHPILGVLEVQTGEDPDKLVRRKLKTLQQAVRKQVNHYFSPASLSKDKFMRAHIDADGYVPAEIIATFDRLKGLTTDVNFIVECMKDSAEVEVSSCGLKLRKRLQ